jgi:hypothetical protein
MRTPEGGGRPKELMRTLNFVRELRAEIFRESPDNASSELKVCVAGGQAFSFPLLSLVSPTNVPTNGNNVHSQPTRFCALTMKYSPSTRALL